jgi:hypothetical protein
MTMLDRMRRHRNWLKWSLGLVCLAFVIFYIPDFLSRNATGAVADGAVAVVGGRRFERRSSVARISRRCRRIGRRTART